jgi:hypothetical protein
VSRDPDRYEGLREENRRRWGEDRFRLLHRLVNHLGPRPLTAIFELLQNAEDAHAKRLHFTGLADGLLVCNDGEPFDDGQVRAVAGIFTSQKELLELGYFGIGFKSVLKFARDPHILSGGHAFRLDRGLDPYPVAEDDLPPEVRKVRRAQPHWTLFWLPWKNPQRAGEILAEVEGELERSGEELLLFLTRLESLSWKGRRPLRWDLAPENLGGGLGRLRVNFRSDGEERESFWLRFGQSFAVPDRVVDEVLGLLAEDGELSGDLRDRWQGLRGKALFAAVALPLEADRENFRGDLEGRVFVGLPTERRPGFRFHVGGRFGVSLDRTQTDDRSPLSRWTVGCLGELLGELPRRLLEAGLFRPSFWKLAPLADEVESFFAGAAERLRLALKGGPFFHADDGSTLPAGRVFLAHSLGLYGLLPASELEELTGREGARWAHPELREGRAREAVRSLGVAEISAGQVLDWLSTRPGDWWAALGPDRWRGLLNYLREMPRDFRDRVAGLPLAPLADGRFVPPAGAFLPPGAELSLPKELEDELLGWNVIDPERVREPDFLEFLRGLGARDFSLAELVKRFLDRRYLAEGSRPSAAENRRHVRLVFRLWQAGHLAEGDLRRLGRVPFLADRTGAYLPPEGLYLPAEYGGLAELEAFFRLSGGRPFVSPGYAGDGAEGEALGRFFQGLGVRRLPAARPVQKNFPYFNKQLEEELRRRGRSESPDRSSTDYALVDWEVDGLEDVLTRAEAGGLDPEEARALWTVLAESLDQKEEVRVELKHQRYSDYYVPVKVSLDFQESAVVWYYYRPDYDPNMDAAWLARLKGAAWLPDRAGRPRPPAELFDPALAEVLGPDGAYVHPDVPLSGEKSRRLARLLGVQLEAGPENLLAALGACRESGSQDRPGQIYRRLNRFGTLQLWPYRSRFEAEPLIFVRKGWWRLAEVCWVDPAGLVPALADEYPALRDLFVEKLGVRERPEAADYARALLRLGSAGVPPDPDAVGAAAPKILEALQDGSLEPELQEGLRTRPCWPGRRGEGLVWAAAAELAVADHGHRARLFEGRAAFWALEGHDSLARLLGVARLSEAEVHEFGPGDPAAWAPEPEATARLQGLWRHLRWFEPGLGAEPPPVFRVPGLWVRYRLGSALSQEDREVSGILAGGRVLVRADEDLDEGIGEALAGAGNDQLREFLKDLWRAPGSEGRVLARWSRRTGRDLGPDTAGAQPAVDVRPEAGPPDEAPAPEPVPDSTDRPVRASPDRSGWPPTGTPPAGAGSHYRPEPLSAPREGPLGSSADRTDTEREAVELVRAWLEEQGYRVRDVSREGGWGCDLVAWAPGEEVRVEVKGRGGRHPIELTGPQWDAAAEQGENYWLVVVRTDEGWGRLIKNPAEKLGDAAERRYVIEESEWSRRGEEIRFR